MRIIVVLDPLGGCVLVAGPKNHMIAKIDPKGEIEPCYVYEPWVSDPDLYPHKEEAEG